MSENKEQAGGGLGTSAFVGALACLAAGAYISYQRQDYVAAGAAGVVAAGLSLGYWKGAVGFLALAAGAYGGYALAGTVDAFLGPTLDAPLGSAGFGSPTVRLGICGVIAAGVIQVVTLIVGKRIVAANPPLKSLNGFIGMSLGGAQATAAVVLFLCGVLTLVPQRSSIIPGLIEPATTNRVEQLAQQTRQSVLFPYLMQYDPYQRFPALRQALEQTRTQAQSPPAPQQQQHGPQPQWPQQSWLPQQPAFFNAAQAPQLPALQRPQAFRGW